MRTRATWCLTLLLAASCSSEFPRDPDRTLDKIRAEQRIDVGLIAPLAASEPKVHALLDRLTQATDAVPAVEAGDAEPLLKRLEAGDLDLVVGRFDKKTPWAKMVTLGPALRTQKAGKTELRLVPVMRNGENAWIGLVERTARDVAPEAQ